MSPIIGHSLGYLDEFSAGLVCEYEQRKSSAILFCSSFSERPSAISARTRMQKSQGQSGLLVHCSAGVGAPKTTTSPVRRWTNSMEPSSSFRRCHLPGSAAGVWFEIHII